MVSWTVSSNNDTAMTAYIALRLAQDNVTLALDDALAELLSHAGIAQDGTASTDRGGIHTHTGRFVHS
jgi:hypothetical protein